MDKPARIQYSVRNVPAAVDAAIRRRARREGKSLNQIVLEAIQQAAGMMGTDGMVHQDLDHLAGKWVDDPEFDEAVAAQDEVDAAAWE